MLSPEESHHVGFNRNIPFLIWKSRVGDLYDSRFWNGQLDSLSDHSNSFRFLNEKISIYAASHNHLEYFRHLALYNLQVCTREPEN